MRTPLVHVGRPILIAAGVGLLLRIAWLAFVHPAPVSDFEYYRRLAVHLLDAHQLGEPRPSAVRVPGYPVFLAVAMLVSRSVTWLSIVNIFISTAIIVVVAGLTEQLTGRRSIAVMAAWLCALDPTFIFFAPVLASEHLFALLLLSSILVMLSGHAAWSGALYGAAILTRPDALFYAPVLIGTNFVATPASSRWRRVAAYAGVTAVVVAPWLVRNRVVLGPGAGLSTIGGLSFYYAHNDRVYGWHPLQNTPLEGLDEVAMQARGYELGFDNIRQHGPMRLVANAIDATRRLYSPWSYPFALHWSTQQSGVTPDDNTSRTLPGQQVWQRLNKLYGLLLVGAIAAPLLARGLPRRAWLVLFGLVFCNWIGYCWISWADPRYRYVAELIFCTLAAISVARMAVRRADP